MKKSALYNYRAYLGIKLWQKVLISLLFLTFLTIVVAWIQLPFNMSTILTASSTLFSILVGFFIASAMANFLRLKTLVSNETGALYNIYSFSKLLYFEISEEFKSAIDKYVISSFDWELVNYVEKTQNEYERIFKIFDEKKDYTWNTTQQNALNQIMNNLTNLSITRNEISIVTKSTLNPLYWGLLIILATLTIISVMVGTEFTVIGVILTIAISTTVVFALFLLDEIDKNKMNESDVAFLSSNLLLQSINLLPYYIETDVKAGRVKPDKSGPYRLCKYKDFPYSFEKDIVIVEG